MLIPLRHGDRSLFLAALLGGIAAGGCSRTADRSPSPGSAASTPAESTVSGSNPAPADSAGDTAKMAPSPASRAAPGPVSKTSPTDTPAKPAQTPKLPKPNIDPGRKPATKPADSGKTATAVPDSTPAPDSTAGSSAAAPAGTEQWLKYDAASNKVTFQLIGGPSGFEFNGHTSGGATLTLPSKADVVLNFINKDGTPHSAEVISGEGALPNSGIEAAIPRAYTNQLIQGLPQEGTDVMRFTAPESGKYRIICGVPGHALSGMWIWLTVDPAAKQPSFGPTKG